MFAQDLVSQSLGKNRVDQLKKSVVRILIDDQAVGTGFFVREDGWILTCYHVIAPAITVKKNGDNTITYSFKNTYAQFDNGEKVKLGYSIFNLEKKFLESLQYDFFFLKTETEPKTKFIPLKLGKYSDLDLGGNAGHSIPPSPDKIEHPPTRHKNLNIRSLIPNIGWLTFSVFGGLNHPAHPLR